MQTTNEFTPARLRMRTTKPASRPYPHLERALAGKGNARISDLNSAAEELDAPLWILFIPDLSKHPELLLSDGMQRLKKLVENYLAMDDRCRQGVDVLARHYAGK